MRLTPALHALVAMLPLCGQDEATTLARLTDRAPDIVVARVLHSEAHGTGMRVVTLQTLRVLRGEAPDRFELSETDGDACGRALRGLLPGMACVAFLAGGDPRRLVVPGPRAIPALDPELLAQVEALLAHPAEEARLALWGRALASPSPRVRADAAQALAQSPRLAAAGPGTRVALLAALQSQLAAPEPATPALLRSAARLQLDAASEALLAAYLARPQPLSALLGECLCALDGQRVATMLAARTAGNRALQLRAVPLLAALPDVEGRRVLMAWSAGVDPAVAAQATRVLRGLRIRQPSGAEPETEPARPAFRAIRPETVR